MTVTGTDLFGMEYTETITNTYILKFGKPIVTRSVVEHSGWDIFGSNSTSTTTTDYTYGFINGDENQVPGSGGQRFYVTTRADVTRTSSGYDISVSYTHLTLPTTPYV